MVHLFSFSLIVSILQVKEAIYLREKFKNFFNSGITSDCPQAWWGLMHCGSMYHSLKDGE